MEPGETLWAALSRELREEIGLVIDPGAPHVWHQKAIGRGYAAGYDGVVNDCDLVRPLAALLADGAPPEPVPMGV